MRRRVREWTSIPKGIRELLATLWVVRRDVAQGIENWVRCCFKGWRAKARHAVAHANWLVPVLLGVLVFFAIHSASVSSRESRNAARIAVAAAATKSRESVDAAKIKATQVAEATQNAASVQGCNRLEIIEASANSNTYGSYLLLMTILRENPALSVPLMHAIDGYTWVPRIDCQSRVAMQGSDYRLPKAISFRMQLPPKSALVPPLPLKLAKGLKR